MDNLTNLPTRNEIDEKYKWKLEDIYNNDDMWEQDFEKVNKLIKGVSKFKGKLESSPDNLLSCLNNYVKLLSVVDKVFVYARMRKDEDNSNSNYQGLTSRAMAQITEVATSISFLTPEISGIKISKMNKFYDKVKKLKEYKFFIDEIYRQKGHCLSEKEEEILAMNMEVAGTAGNAFSMLNNVDIKFPEIKDEDGNTVELTKGRYIKFLESTNRKVREEAFNALYDSYSNYKNTLASLLVSNVKKNIFYSKVKKYTSSVEASLDSDNISIDVYDNLIETVSDNLHVFHKYLDIKKKALSLDELQLYDLFVPINKSNKKNIPYEKALKTVESGLKVLGDEYIGYLKEGYNSGWIDVYETKDKTSGAYSWGAYKTHPYVLLNYQGTLNDIFTLAHEMGHALHTFYSNKTQPYIYSEYKIFVAEVASTVNESLLINYLIENTKNKEEKKYLIHHYLEEFRGTVFRQVMFAEFEKIIHKKSEEGIPLTLEALNEIYYELNKKYFGKNLVIDKKIEIEWSRIPHFYSSFYVYKYATGFSSATAIAKNILSGKKNASKNYIDFLKSGGSDYPIELLKKAGVDLTTPKPIEDALSYFGELVNKLESLI